MNTTTNTNRHEVEVDTRIAAAYAAEAKAARNAAFARKNPTKFGVNLDAAEAALADAIAASKEVAAEYKGWSRFFLVPAGHIHADTNCHTLRCDTLIGWLPELSGLTEADAVEAHGEILCSHCFPTAPVAWTNGESKISKAQRAERDAKKAERQAQKIAKALIPSDPDGGIKVQWDRIKTIAAAKQYLKRAAEYGFDHPAYPVEDVARVREALEARLAN